MKTNVTKFILGLLLISILASCAGVGGSKGNSGAGNLCILDYNVKYEHNEVPDWYTKPADFCDGSEKKAVPLGTSVYPLKFTGYLKKNNKIEISASEHWFYVVWACFGPCSSANYGE